MKFNLKKELLRFLAEDLGRGDISSALLPRKKIKAKIISREAGIIAGVNFAKEIFLVRNCKVQIFSQDGSTIKPNQTILEISGIAKNILECERTALNLISRMSGIATQTNILRKKFRGNKTKLYATRKTAPGLRFFDKEAVKIGGGKKHRMSLDEMVMLKDNHIAIGGNLIELIKKAKLRHQKIEVEVEDQNNALIAAREGATIIMLDNFTPREIKKTIQSLKRENLRNKVILEASGGINRKNITSYSKTGVDAISVGEITNSVKGIDFSLETQ